MGNEVTVLDNETLQTLLVEWQQRLRLQDWEIHARFVPSEKIPDNLGQNKTNVISMEARITISDPATWDDEDFAHDIELTLVHELLHCYWVAWNGFEEGSFQGQACHQTLDRMAKIMLALKRGGGSNAPE